jgi:hypothetical protein
MAKGIRPVWRSIRLIHGGIVRASPKARLSGAGKKFSAKRLPIYRDELRRIEKKYGMLTTDAVVKEASRTSNPLHSEFQWDDAIAAHKYRLTIASTLIRFVMVDVQMAPGRTPEAFHVFYSVPQKDAPSRRHYVDFNDVSSDKEYESYVINAARLRLKSWTQEYGRVKRLRALALIIGKWIDSLTDEFGGETE